MVAAVGKAAALLRAYGPAVDVLSTRQLADRTRIPRSTVHTLASTLGAEGLLETVAGRGYRLGPLLVGLAGQIIERTGLVAAAEGELGPLLRIVGHEVHVGQLVGGWVVYLHRETGPIRPPMDNRVGLGAGLACGLREGRAGPPERRRGRIPGPAAVRRGEAAAPAPARSVAELDAGRATAGDEFLLVQARRYRWRPRCSATAARSAVSRWPGRARCSPRPRCAGSARTCGGRSGPGGQRLRRA